jgi:hypothetical protein
MMNSSVPTARSAGSPETRAKIQTIVSRRGLSGLANDTKWDEFISAIRDFERWRPSYRVKCVDGSVSGWDAEWFYHLPYPLVSVEWMDVAFLETERKGKLATEVTTDRSPEIEAALKKSGLDHIRGITMFRIFGYAPRSKALFDE